MDAQTCEAALAPRRRSRGSAATTQRNESRSNIEKDPALEAQVPAGVIVSEPTVRKTPRDLAALKEPLRSEHGVRNQGTPRFIAAAHVSNR